jgi:hypothetical protein
MASVRTTIGFLLILAGSALPATHARAQSPLQASFTINLPFGPFGQSQAIVIMATVTNVSPSQVISICSGVCVGDANTYSLSSQTSTPAGYTFFSGDDPDANTDAFDDQIVGSLAPGQTKQFVYGVYTPLSAVLPQLYPFAAEIRTFAATPERPLLRTDGFGGDWGVTALPVYSCEGFQDPFDVQPSLRPNTNKPISFRAQLFDGSNLVGAASINVPPIADVRLMSDTAAVSDDSAQFAARKPSDGNAFEFDKKTGNWTLKLSTRPFTMPGVYVVTMQSGDTNSYFVSPRCVGTFLRQ